jgi:hypothetical protein
MTTQTANYLEAIGHLPAGGTLILTDVPWKDYEQLLHDLGICGNTHQSVPPYRQQRSANAISGTE